MGFKNLRLKLKVFRLRRFLIGGGGNKKREAEIIRKKPSWMLPISHGYYVVEDRSLKGESSELDSDSVVVQREQIEEHEVWFFGVFDARIGDRITKYMQSHLLDKKLKESQMRKRSKETMRKAYIGATAKIRETQKPEELWKVGSASAIVINGEKLVIASMGDYRAVVCRDGEAHQITTSDQQITKRHWSRRFIQGTKPSKSSEVLVGSDRIDQDTEFLILASTGIWEVMKHQEAVNLIRHIDDSQEAAEYLAKEALTRMSRSTISCLVIRFD
ncbi:unnamed protein product [Ilex paraguariensis]|uniref:PPM-type phosphatase domain-containing protein n=1 Tax=Ilex paraguariensis TaxID=185542 RepID=A0ABC8RXR8_9AQUA